MVKLSRKQMEEKPDEVKGFKTFEGVLQTLTIKGAKYENVPLHYREDNE